MNYYRVRFEREGRFFIGYLCIEGKVSHIDLKSWYDNNISPTPEHLITIQINRITEGEYESTTDEYKIHL